MWSSIVIWDKDEPTLTARVEKPTGSTIGTLNSSLYASTVFSVLPDVRLKSIISPLNSPWLSPTETTPLVLFAFARTGSDIFSNLWCTPETDLKYTVFDVNPTLSVDTPI